MQDWPLTLNCIIEHAAKWHGDREVLSRRPDGPLERTSYAEIEVAARRFSSALLSLGIVPGDRVATMAMNSGRHLECWYGIMGIGAVCHTLNPRLFNADLELIVNRAADSVVIVDRSLAAKLAGVLSACPSVRHVVFIEGAGPVTQRSARGYCLARLRCARRSSSADRAMGRVSGRHRRGPLLHVWDDQSAQGGALLSSIQFPAHPDGASSGYAGSLRA